MGLKMIFVQMIFDIIMDGEFAQEAILVADGHKTNAPSSLTYSSTVSRESVQ